MRTFGKIFAGLIIVIMAIAGGGYWWFSHTYPKVGPASDLKVSATPEMIGRGRYLAEHVSSCIDCHSVRDWRYYAAPIKEETRGQGGELFDHSIGVPGTLYAANITPAGIGNYTDGELHRMIVSGVKRTGEPVFPIMPYPHFGAMADDDINSIIAYIRTLAPIENTVPPSELDFPLNLIVRTMPQQANPQPRPDPSNTVAYGGYLVNAAACGDCHTPMVKGQFVQELAFAGGSEYRLPGGCLARSANITPDQETGIGKWTKEQFLARFKKYADDANAHVPVDSGAFNTIMPWTRYAGMTEEDLGAIFDYLRTLKPISHSVIHFDRASLAAE